VSGGRQDDGALKAPEAVLETILARLSPLRPARCPLSAAAGSVLAEAVTTRFPLPRFSNAAMDGYAICGGGEPAGPRRQPAPMPGRQPAPMPGRRPAPQPGRQPDGQPEGQPGRESGTPGSTPASWRAVVVGRALAGVPWSGSLGPGEAVAIATGAALPDGADRVIPLEHVQLSGTTILFPPVPYGANVRWAGEDLAAGAVVVAGHSVLGPGQLAACAAAGVTQVSVHPRPRVAILPTGTEVRPAGSPLGPTDVYDAVSVPVAALVDELGARPVRLPPVPDDPAAILAALGRAARRADLIVTVGGVSVGERDLVRTLNTAGQVSGYRLALAPAKPFAWGMMFGRPLLGLPGNPGAALVAFEVLVRPVILHLLGREALRRTLVPATLTEPISGRAGRLHLLRMQVWWAGDRLLAKPAGRPGAAMMSALAATNAWAVLPPDAGEVPAGSEIAVALAGHPGAAAPAEGGAGPAPAGRQAGALVATGGGPGFPA
jgi:molybdopterin molybdotransferase